MRASGTFGSTLDVGTVARIEEEVDLNVFNGTMEELLELTLKTPCIERLKVNFSFLILTFSFLV